MAHSNERVARRGDRTTGWLLAGALASAGCSATAGGGTPDGGPLGDRSVPTGDGACAGGIPNLQTGVRIPVVNNAVESVDILFEVDNSSSMSENQLNLARNFSLLIDRLVNPPVNPMAMRPQYPPVKSPS